MIDPNELAPLKASVEWRGNEGHFEEQCLAPEQPSRFSLRPVDVFRDLGMTLSQRTFGVGAAPDNRRSANKDSPYARSK